MTKKEKVESSMMFWESTSNFSEEEPHEELEKVAKKPVEMTEKQKHEEEHVGPTLDTSSRLKISIEEFSWEREDDGSTLEMEEPQTTRNSVHQESRGLFTREQYKTV